MADRPKILLLDDDQDLLDLYKEILSQLPSHPEIFTSNNGPRALAMMDAEPFTVLVCDLNMPKMDGLQVLSIVRKKLPDMRTVVLTSIIDEQFRSRVYGLGVDLYWQKPGTGEEIKQFLDCIESLLGREAQKGGFRGVQSKSLVDIIQLECLSQNSLVLKILNGPLTGRIWIQNGEVIDAATEELVGEEAFRRILSWRAGNFESLAPEPSHARVIFNSYQGLLLETAQAQDEAHVLQKDGTSTTSKQKSSSPLATIARYPGVEFVLIMKPGTEKKFDARGLENPGPMADWGRQTLEQFRSLGDRLRAGPLHELDGFGTQRHVTLAPYENRDFCVGWQHSLTADQIGDSMKKLFTLWAS
jgi:CheY-like chemotaxis protein